MSTRERTASMAADPAGMYRVTSGMSSDGRRARRDNQGEESFDYTTLFPPLDWVPKYNVGEYLKGDVIAGLTVGFMLIPQGMAYALLCGVPPIYGLYASTWTLITYSLFGTSRQLAVGPTAVMCLLVGKSVDTLVDKGLDEATREAELVKMCAMFSFTVGLLCAIMGMLRFEFGLGLGFGLGSGSGAGSESESWSELELGFR